MDGNGTERKRVSYQTILVLRFSWTVHALHFDFQKFYKRLNLRVKVHISLLTKATKIHPGGVITERSEGMSLSS